MKIKNKFLFEFPIYLILVYLLTCFIISSVVSFKASTSSEFNKKDIILFSHRFLTEQYFIDKGKKLDCSGFSFTIYRKFGISIPRSSQEQFQRFSVKESNLEISDLLFFKTDGREVGHVAIYLGDSLFIHSPGINKIVKIDSLTNNYYSQRFIAVGKVSNHSGKSNK